MSAPHIHSPLRDHVSFLLAGISEMGLLTLLGRLSATGVTTDSELLRDALDECGWVRDGVLPFMRPGLTGTQARYVRRHVA